MQNSTSDYSAATGASALLAQAEEWHISPNTVNHATAGNTFMLGVGGVFTVWFSAYFGRLPVIFFMTLISAATAIWSAAAQSFESYMASRILNGLFAVSAAGGGLQWINDVFFFHERPRMINLWSTAIILSPFLGPCFMAAMLQEHTWRDGLYLNFAIIAFALITIAVLGDETFYPRHKPAAEIPDIYSKPRVLRLIGVPQFQTKYTDNTFLGAGNRALLSLSRFAILIICVFYFFDFGWTVANNTTISVLLVPAYQLTYFNLAALYCAPIIGAILGMVVGHFLFDFIGKIWAKRNNGIIDPEARLIPIWLVLPFKIIGYNLIGLTMQKHWSYYVLAVGWGMHNFATIVTTAAVAAYLIDAYPEASGESAAWLNFSRTLAGFILGYVQLNWAAAQGPEIEYGIQTAIMGGAFLVFVVPMTFLGKKVRNSQGPLNFKTN